MRGLLFVGLTLVVACGLLVAAMPPTSAYVRTDVVDETFVNVYLKWNDGKGTLSWSPDAPTEDDVASPHTAPDNADTFVSAPAPRTLYVNASKLTQLDLFLKSSASRADVEVWVGKDFYGGGLSGYTDGIVYGNPKTCNNGCANTSQKPTAPGYATHSHRLAAELDVIPAGSILTLRLTPVNGGTNVYGLSGEHGSVLRFPTFSADEVLYRIPKYQRPAAPGPESPVVPPGAVDDLLSKLLHDGALGVAALGPLRRRRRTSTASLIPAVLVAGAFAGCAGNDPVTPSGPPEDGPGPGGSASSYLVRDETNETGLTNPERGNIYGLVSDPEGLPVNGAFAALLGQRESTRTDPWGRFHFNGLAPGFYTLHIDRDGFLPLETTVEVKAASITKVEAVLGYASDTDRDHRPHRHDYWFDAAGRPIEAVVLIDNAAPYYQHASGESSWVIPPPLLVSPGTVEVEVNVTWPGGSSALLYVDIPNDPHNSTILYPRESGRSFHVRTTWEMTDPGHAAYSYWRSISARPLEVPCAQYAFGRRDPNCPFNFGLPLADSTANAHDFHLRVTLRKGVVPLEPPHPDHWAERAIVPVLVNETQTMRGYCDELCPIAYQNDDSAQVSIAGLHFGTTRRAYNASWSVRGFVPFETQWLDATLRASRPVTGAGQAPWKLYYRDATTSNFGSCDPNRDHNRAASREAIVHSTHPADPLWTWRIPVTVAGADPPYAKASNWCFFAAPTDQNAYMVDDYAQQYGQGQVAKMALTLSVDAHRDPMPKF